MKSFPATMPPGITASTGMDALSHAIEAFLSLGSNPITDSFALEAMIYPIYWSIKLPRLR